MLLVEAVASKELLHLLREKDVLAGLLGGLDEAHVLEVVGADHGELFRYLVVFVYEVLAHEQVPLLLLLVLRAPLLLCKDVHALPRLFIQSHGSDYLEEGVSVLDVSLLGHVSPIDVQGVPDDRWASSIKLSQELPHLFVDSSVFDIDL